MSLTKLQQQADEAFERTRREALQRGINVSQKDLNAGATDKQKDVQVRPSVSREVRPNDGVSEVKPAALPSLQWGPILTWGAVGCAALYLYKTVKDDGVVVNETTGEKRSVFRWIDIMLGTLLATYLIRMVFTF